MLGAPLSPLALRRGRHHYGSGTYRVSGGNRPEPLSRALFRPGGTGVGADDGPRPADRSVRRVRPSLILLSNRCASHFYRASAGPGQRVRRPDFDECTGRGVSPFVRFAPGAPTGVTLHVAILTRFIGV